MAAGSVSGRLVTFEGGEGSGKSTQARRLAAWLEGRGLSVLLTREPGGSPFAEAVRRLLLDPDTPTHDALSEALLFYSARADHLRTVIRPALAAGRWVVCDRFVDSTHVYQGYAGNLDGQTLATLDAVVVAPTFPDLTLIIDVPAELGIRRAAERGGASARADAETRDPYERRSLAFHERLRQGFLALAAAEPRRCAVVDGTKTIDEIARDVERLVHTRLLGSGT